MNKDFLSKFFAVAVIVTVLMATFLRIYRLNEIPSSLYWEEAALGYDAYSILHTGKDHHGNPFPVVAFTSFGDFKPSGYFYAIVPFLTIFGLNEWSVRLPSALAGVATVIGIGSLVHYLSSRIWPHSSNRFQRFCFLVGLGVATFSPWLIQFSRGGWEVNLATSLLLWSVVLGLWSLKSKKNLLLISSVVLAAASMYVYHATRVVAPAVLFGVFLLRSLPYLEQSKFQLKGFFEALKRSLLPGCFFLLLAAPLLISSRNSSTQQRFAETSIASDGQYVLDSNHFREVAGNNIFAKALSHRYIVLGEAVTSAFLSHFSMDFLFISGDKNPRHSTGMIGLLALPDGVWLIVGVVLLASKSLKQKSLREVTFFLCWWLCIGILPAALTKAFPHALRILPTAPVFLSVVSIGLIQAILWLKNHFPTKLFAFSLLIILVVSAGFWMNYWRFYTNIYPTTSQSDWQYGYKEMVGHLNKEMSEYPESNVFVTREYGRPAMYYWFFSQTDPRLVQAAETTSPKDQGEFLQYQNISFINTVNEAKAGIVASSDEGYQQLTKTFKSVKKLNEVRDLRGNVIWTLSLVE